MEAVADKIAKKPALTGRPTGKLKLAEYERSTYMVGVAPGFDLNDAQMPEYWAHVAVQLKPNDRIEIIPHDFAWFAELIVMQCDRTWAKTAMLRFVELTGSEVAAETLASLSSGYEVKYMGPTKKHCVIRLSDKTIVQEGIGLKAEANRWVSEHLQALAR